MSILTLGDLSRACGDEGADSMGHCVEPIWKGGLLWGFVSSLSPDKNSLMKKTPTKSSFSENNIYAVHVHKSKKHTLGNFEVTPNSSLKRLNCLEKRAQLHTTARLTSKEKLKKARESPKSYSRMNLHKQLLV